MTNILHIKSSILGDAGQSNQISQKFVDQYLITHGGSELTVRDLSENPIPHLTGEAIGGYALAPENRTEAQAEAAALSDTLINELRTADIIVMGLPMYNFGVSSSMKAWIDYVARAGETFTYTENGPVGLLKGKKAYIFAARGGKYVGTPTDTQTGFIETILKFFGIVDYEIVYAEGLNMGDEPKADALAAANVKVAELAAA